VDRLSDQVVLLSHGYVVAEGQIHGVRDEVRDQPAQILVRCHDPRRLARMAFDQDAVMEARIQDDGDPALALAPALLVRTRDPDRFYKLINRAVVEDGLEIEAVAPADDDVGAVYQYLIGSEGGPSL
jgi:ABC-2 type transport system ATP-binding protein